MLNIRNILTSITKPLKLEFARADGAHRKESVTLNPVELNPLIFKHVVIQEASAKRSVLQY